MEGKKGAAGLDCSTCHEDRVKQFRAGKHAPAWAAMKAMPMMAYQLKAVVGEGYKGCSGCHKIGDKSAEELASFKYGTGSCDACHTRHSFSVKEARDSRAYQTCHTPDGDHAVMTSWGFLALRLPEKDQDWLNDRVEILKALGVLDAEGNPTERLEAVKVAKIARLTKEEFDGEREEMINICSNCHSKSYVQKQLSDADMVIKETDKIFAEAIREIKKLYQEGLLKKPEGWKYAPDLLQFYEAKSNLEQELYLMFMEYSMRAFHGAFHANPDYMHWYGWAPMKETLTKIKDEAEKMRLTAKK